MVADDNIIDYQQWTTVIDGGFKGIQSLGNELYTVNNSNTILKLDPVVGFLPIDSFLSSVVDFGVVSNVLTITTKSSIHAFSEGYTLLSEINNLLEYDYSLQSGYSFNNTFYLGTTELGMLVVPFEANQAQQILPDGPLFNQPFAIDASPGQLWVAFGDVDLTFNPFPLTKKGISNYRNETWKNIKYDSLTDVLGVNDVNDLVFVKINPNSPFITYMSSFQKGLMRLNGQDPFILYNETNSPMDIPNGNENIGIRIYGSDFDRDENLWFVQSKTDNGLVKLTPEGQFQTLSLIHI